MEVKTAPPVPSRGSCQILVPAEAWESRDRTRKGGWGVTEPTSTELWGRPPEQVRHELGVRWHLYGRTCASPTAGRGDRACLPILGEMSLCSSDGSEAT